MNTSTNQPMNKTNAQLGKVFFGLFSIVALFMLCLSYSDGWFMSNELCISIVIAVAAISVVYGMRDARNRMLFMFFNITFFLFLTGGIASAMMTGEYLPGYLDVSETGVSHTCHVLAISLLTVDLMYILLDGTGALTSLAEKPVLHRKRKPTPIQKGTKQVVWILFLVTLAAKFGAAVIQFRFLDGNTYRDSYIIGYNKPVYISLLESYFFFGLCLWLAARPTKKQFIPFFIIILLEQALILLSGDRAEPMVVLLLLFYYIYSRGKEEPSFIQLTPKRLIVLCALIPVMILTLQTVKYTRLHESVPQNVNLFAEFMEDQGSSALVISKGYVYRDKMTDIGGSSFTFGAFRNYLKQNMVSRNLFGIQPIGMNTVEAATSGDSFGSTLAYIRFRDAYLNGMGCGSSYIAELYHDGGIIQLIIGSGVVALLLSYVSKKFRSTRSLYGQAFTLLLFRNMLLLPRVNSMSWLTSTFSVQNLLVLAVLLIANQLFSMYSNKKEVSA